MILGYVKTEEKSNEITAIPELFTILELKGCIVTIDAMGCQETITRDIVKGCGDYAIAVKGNQGHLHDSIIDFLTAAEEHVFKGVDYQQHETVDKGHGRVEIRRYWVSHDLNSIHKPEKWKKLHAIGMAES